MRYFLAIVLPPVAVLACGKPFQAVGNIFLTLAGWLPGVVHALFVADNHRANELSMLSERIMPQQQLAWDIAASGRQQSFLESDQAALTTDDGTTDDGHSQERIASETNSFDQVAKPKQPKLYSAPRRFDLATMLVVTTAFALLFTGMTVLDFNFWVFLYFACLIVMVGCCQSLFVPRYNPRSVSLVAGILYQATLTIGFFVFTLYFANKFPGQVRYLGPTALLCPMFVMAIFSPLLGYLSGVLVAGTFLVAEQLRGFLGLLHLHRTTDDEHDASSPWDE